jgi:hypothetical protein
MEAEMDAIAICNMALNQLKANNILSFDDNTEEAYQCRRMYDFCREAILRKLPWGFARRVAPLSLTAHESPLWGFLYKYPADCLFVRRLFGKGAPRRAGWEYIDDKQTMRTHEVFSVPEAGKAIGSNVAQAYIDYTFDARDADGFPPDFVSALYYSLASELALALSADASLKQLNFQLMQQALREGARQNGNENRDRFRPARSILEARL